MPAKRLMFRSAAREKVLAGAAALADAVRITLGPKSKCVLIQKKWGRPLVCNDGITMFMGIRKSILALLGVVLIGTFAAGVRAQTFSKMTTVKFNQPIEIPGQVLPAGTYIFTVAESATARNVLQVWNEDKTNLIATVLAIPDYRLQPTDETVIEFHERPATSPKALRGWFYPGDTYGMEFVYPKVRATQLAEAANVVVPAEAVEPTPATDLKTVPLVAVTPQKTEEPIAKGIETTPPPTVAQALPKAGSPIPLIGLLGLVLLGIAIVLNRLRTRIYN